jgi:hypothetical protein
MPDNNIEWGQGGVNNSNDWGKAKANIMLVLVHLVLLLD